MNVRPAESILYKVEFNSYEDWETYPESEYKCRCGQSISFNFRNIQKHSYSDFTNLRKEDVMQIEHLIDETIKAETNSFLDFYCPGCKKPVRFYFLSWAGGRQGENGCHIKFVVD